MRKEVYYESEKTGRKISVSETTLKKMNSLVSALKRGEMESKDAIKLLGTDFTDLMNILAPLSLIEPIYEYKKNGRVIYGIC